MPNTESKQTQSEQIKQVVTDDYILNENEKYVETSPKTEPYFTRDVIPTLQPTLMIFIVHGIYWYTGNIMLGLWLMYVGKSFYDKFLLDDSFNISKKYEKEFAKYSLFKLPMYSYILTSACFWVYYLYLFSDNPKPDHWLFKHTPQTTFHYVVFCLAAAFMGVLGNAAGHELIHYKETIHKIVGSIPYFTSFNTHFHDEHVRGHHKYVSTHEDPVFPPLNTNVYYAVIYAYIGTHVTTWKREVERITKKDPKISFYRMVLQNIMFYYFILHVCTLVAIYKLFGYGGLKFALMYGFLQMAFLESGNYGEHYGLERRKDENGIYESIQCQHSWNAVSSPFFFRLQRHSDHHCHAYRPYQIVKKLSLAPQLPFCYTNGLMMMFVPPVFFYMMNPRVKAIQDAQNGIPNDDQWNATQPLSENDKIRYKNLEYFYYAVLIVLTYLTFA